METEHRTTAEPKFQIRDLLLFDVRDLIDLPVPGTLESGSVWTSGGTFLHAVGANADKDKVMACPDNRVYCNRAYTMLVLI